MTKNAKTGQLLQSAPKQQYRKWEGAYQESTCKVEDAKRTSLGRGGKPSGAIVDIFRRLFNEKQVEEAMKFQFDEEKVAQNFRDALNKHVHTHLKDKKDVIVLTRCSSTVYVYRTA